MVEDASSVLHKYADMMTYEPDRPSEEFLFKKWKVGTKHPNPEDRVPEDEVHVVEDDEEFDEEDYEEKEDL
jgi:hypothetical protein